MFTNQWNAFLLSAFNTTSSSSISIQSGICKDVEGNDVTSISISYNYKSNLKSNTNYIYDLNEAGIKFGKGTTSPTKTDYCLSNICTSSELTGNANSGAYNLNSTGQLVYTYSNTVTNTSSSSLTINEVGLVWGQKFSSTGSYDGLLIWRDVLETPITLAAGETKTIETVITFPAGA